MRFWFFFLPTLPDNAANSDILTFFLRDLHLNNIIFAQKYVHKFCFFWFISWYQPFAASIESLLCALYLYRYWYGCTLIFPSSNVVASFSNRSENFLTKKQAKLILHAQLMLSKKVKKLGTNYTFSHCSALVHLYASMGN